MPIMYKFSEDEGGWAIGVISASLQDETDMVEVLVTDDITGSMPKNFEITFEDDTIRGLLEADDYATTAGCDEGGWCLMAQKLKRGGGGGKGKANQGKGAAKIRIPTKGKEKAAAESVPSSKISPASKARKKAQLQAELDALEDDDE